MRIRSIKGKHASLNLSVNAIIVLILAIVILGLALTFITGAWEKTTRPFLDKSQDLNEQVPDSLESANDVVVLHAEELRTKSGGEKELYIMIKNKDSSIKDFTLTVADGVGQASVSETAGTSTITHTCRKITDTGDVACPTGATAASTGIQAVYHSNLGGIGPNSNEVTKLRFKVGTNAAVGMYSIPIKIAAAGSEEVRFVTISVGLGD